MGVYNEKNITRDYNKTESRINWFAGQVLSPIINTILKSKGIKLSYNQINYLDHLNNYKFPITLKARQSGETLVTTLFLFDKYLTEGANILILVNNIAQIDNIKQLFDSYYHTLNLDTLNYSLIQNGITNINCNKLIISTTLKFGTSFDYIYIDEAAYNRAFTNILTLAIPSAKNNLIISSTFNGLNGFYSLYRDTIYGNTIFKPFKLSFLDNPINNIEKITQLRSLYSQREFDQAINCIPTEAP